MSIWAFNSPNRVIRNLAFRGNLLANPADSTTYNLTFNVDGYFNTVQKLIFPIRNIIKSVSYVTYSNTIAGSGEPISVYLRKNNLEDFLLGTVSTVDRLRDFSKKDLNILMEENDFLEFKMITPAWVTNPTNMFIYWTVYSENE